MTRRALLLLLALLLGLGMPGASSASSSDRAAAPCRVIGETGSTYASRPGLSALQAAISAAPAGSTLVVMGRCVGTFTITRDIHLKGKSAAHQPDATLDAAGCGTVLTVAAATVSVADLAITGGADGSVTGCSGEGFGGGIVNNGGTLLLSGLSIHDNHASGSGGGIVNSDGHVTLSRSSVRANRAFSAGGGIVTSGGTFTIDRSMVADNSATMGGGIWSNASVLVVDDSSITRNEAINGGGIAASSTDLVLRGSTSITRNTAFGFGGGLLLADTTLSVDGWSGSISLNDPDNCSPAISIGSSTCS